MATKTSSVTMTSEAEAALGEILAKGPHPDPYPLYRRIREEGPLLRSEQVGMWFATSYKANEEVMLNPSLGQGENAARTRMEPRFEQSPFLQASTRLTTSMDPPDHTRIRSLVNRAFTPKRIEKLEPYVTQVVDELLDEAEKRDDPDLARDFAELIPVTVMCELLGVPVADRQDHLRWTHEVSRSVNPVVSDEDLQAADHGVTKTLEYFEALIAERRSNPTDDLLSSLIAIEEQGERLSTDELTVLAWQLLAAGTETAISLVGHALLALIRNPDERRRLAGSPDLDKTAVEEFLRYEAPLQMNFPRYALADTFVAGVEISEGDVVVPVLGAGNRDPDQFSDPDRLDVGRLDAQPLTFGKGIHFCLGAAVARLEGRVAVGTVIRRFPDLELAGEPCLRGSAMIRSLSSLPVSLR